MKQASDEALLKAPFQPSADNGDHLERSIAWVHGAAGKSLAVPLKPSAMDVLFGQCKKHWQWVFPLNGRPMYRCNNKAFQSAMKRAGITNFR